MNADELFFIENGNLGEREDARRYGEIFLGSESVEDDDSEHVKSNQGGEISGITYVGSNEIIYSLHK